MADRSILVRLGLNASDFVSGIRTAATSLDDLAKKGDKTGQTASTGLGRMEQSLRLQSKEWSTVGLAIGAAGAAVTALTAGVAKTGIEYNTLQQSSRAALTTMMGGAAEAAAQMNKLDEFVRTSPFAKPVFLQAQQQMLAFGIEAQKVVPYLSAVQDAVAAAGGSGQKLSEIVAVMSKIKSAAKITGTDLMQFGNHGIDAAALIGAAMGKTGAQIKADITAGAIGADEALDALAKGMEQRFGGAAASVKEGMSGATDSLKAAFREMSSIMVDPLVGKEGGGALVSLTNGLAGIIRQVNQLPAPLLQATGAFAALGGVGATALGGFMVMAPKIRDLHQSLVSLGEAGVPVFSKLASSMTSLPASLKALPSAVRAVGASFQSMGSEMALASTLGATKMGALKAGVMPVLSSIGGAAKSMGSALLSAVGGPIGLAVAGATAGFIAYSNAVTDAKNRTQMFAQATAGMEDPTQKVAAQQKTLNEAIIKNENVNWGWVQKGASGMKTLQDALDAAKVSTNDYSAAIVGGESSRNALISQLERMVEAGDLNRVVFDQLKANIGVLGTSFDKAAEEAARLDGANADLAGSADDASDGLQSEADAAAAVAGELEGLKGAMQGLIDLHRAQSDSIVAVNAAESNWLETLQGVNGAIAENGASLDKSTEAGRANWQVLSDLRSSALDYSGAMLEAVDTNGQYLYSVDDVSTHMEQARQAFIDAYVAASDGAEGAAEEAAHLADQYGLIPDLVATTAEMRDEASNQVEVILSQYEAIPPEVTSAIVAHGEDALAVTEQVIRALESGVPPETIVDIVAQDNVSDVAAAADAAIAALPKWYDVMIRGEDQVSGVAAVVQGAINTIPMDTTTKALMMDQATAGLQAVTKTADAVPKKTNTTASMKDNASRGIQGVTRNANSVPKSTNTTLNAKDNASWQINSVRNSLRNLDGSSATVTINQVTSGAGHAMGGAIVGAGTGTSDSIPVMLSNGEHVWTDAEVKGIGGQAAMYALRAQARANPQAFRSMIGLANGGTPTMPAPCVFTPATPTPQPMVIDGAQITGKLEIADDGLAKIIDGRIYAWSK